MSRIGSSHQWDAGLGGRDERTRQQFAELAMPLCDPLYNFARWLARNPDDADDLVQETYLKALRSFGTFQPGSNFRGWMFRILRNTFLSSCSHRKRWETVPLDMEEESPVLPTISSTPESLLIEQSDTAAIRSAIEHLPVHFREVIVLRDGEELSYREIAEVLSVPIGTVMSRLARARTALRESFGTDSQKTPEPGHASGRVAEEGSHRRGIEPSLGELLFDIFAKKGGAGGPNFRAPLEASPD